MKILAVESSCDETAVAVVEDGRTVLTDCIASQVALHRLYGGVVPELASRKHIEAIYALADEALSRASMTRQEIDAIAVTYAPGLIGAVLVGVNFAKAAAYSLGVPLVPVHHIRGHIAANYLAYPDLEPPFLCLVVSGGHTLIVDVQDYTKFHIMGTTRDDAAGECFDKIARVIGLASSVLFDKDDPEAAINRRISIVVMTKRAEAAALAIDNPNARLEVPDAVPTAPPTVGPQGPPVVQPSNR